jgi:hypothetical protein
MGLLIATDHGVGALAIELIRECIVYERKSLV